MSADTIFALATPAGRSALAVVRLSGPNVLTALRHLTFSENFPPRKSVLRGLWDKSRGVKLDEALLVFFAGPASFTGEDCAELSIHGGRSVIRGVLSALSATPGLRMAEPGEFTRRAFLHKKLDLSQAEAIADLIDSETEYQRRQALRILDGALGRKLEDWRARLLDLSASLEASLDFNDEGDVADLETNRLRESASLLQREMEKELCLGERSAALRDGFTIVIAGPPNSGKSTLFNLLVGRETAIVTDIPGTTRDLIVARLDLNGVPVTLIDSAGLRSTEDPVELIGIERTHRAVKSADLALWLCGPGSEGTDYTGDAPVLPVWSKADLAPPPGEMLAISAHRAESLTALEAVLRNHALAAVGDGSEGSLIRERHKLALKQGLQHLARLQQNLTENLPELAAEDCRAVNFSLGRIHGIIDTEEVLGEIFSRFCIGK